MKHLLLWIPVLCLLATGSTSAKVFKTESRIAAVSKHSISVKIGQAKHSYKISRQTEIHIDGRKADAKDLKKGMHAEVTASLIDPDTASAIEASHGS